MGLERRRRQRHAAGRFYIFGQSNGADFAQRLAVNGGATLPIAGIAPQSSQLDSAPPRSAAGPYNLNQPRSGGPAVAQMSIHGTEDHTIAYNGGPKFNSPIFEMYPEPESDAVWARHNGCRGPLTSRNVSSTFNPGDVLEAPADVTNSAMDGVATHWTWNGCPATAPVEYFQDHGAGHVGTISLEGKPTFEVALDFFEKVERAHEAAALVEEPRAS